ncbi:unnamed protein product [Hydatigera taeniaeformis]|uniref:F5/8 type C domain-containing protein n=1 Tax=Hydatigena taeniaeformis TaxID=6205 RepID=A0A0R3WTE7_HYDTA|nr:unnamed protein product [Hydatigera taeniaeformis]
MSPGNKTLQYRAWCPVSVQPHEEKEFLEVDLGQQSFVKLIITKGLSTADKGGLYLTPFYHIRYRREDPASQWIKYQNINGTMVRILLLLFTIALHTFTVVYLVRAHS